MQRQDDLLNDMPIVLVGGPFCPSFLASLTPCSTRTHTHHPPFALLADFSAAQSTVPPCQPSYPPSRVPPALPGPNAAHATPDVPLRVPPWHHGGAVVAGALPATMQSTVQPCHSLPPSRPSLHPPCLQTAGGLNARSVATTNYHCFSRRLPLQHHREGGI